MFLQLKKKITIVKSGRIAKVIIFLTLVCRACNEQLLLKKSDYFKNSTKHAKEVFENHPVSNSKLLKHKKQLEFQVFGFHL